MPVTKTYEETMRVRGSCAEWFDRCVQALHEGRFGRIRADDESFIADADYKGLTVHGEIKLLLTQEGDEVEIEVRISAAMDNIYAAFRDPRQRILQAFKSNLPPAG
jgi:hypothetical protein